MIKQQLDFVELDSFKKSGDIIMWLPSEDSHLVTAIW